MARLLDKKIQDLRKLRKIISYFKARRKKIVFTNGCFDLLHYGHVKYLQDAKRKGDILVVGINSDTSVKMLKGEKRPIVNEKDRLRIVASLESVDYAVLFKEDTPLKIIKFIKPDVLVKGADWNRNNIAGKDFVISYGGCVSTIRLVKGYSTSNLIKQIAKRFPACRQAGKTKVIYRVIDANINRAKEGLRVCEEITRFILESYNLTSEFKKIRHRTDAILKYLPRNTKLFKERESLADVGRKIYINELKRRNYRDIFFANIQRVKESIRVLEEFTKLINKGIAVKFKRLRYDIYELEKKAAERMPSLCNRR